MNHLALIRFVVLLISIDLIDGKKVTSFLFDKSSKPIQVFEFENENVQDFRFKRNSFSSKASYDLIVIGQSSLFWLQPVEHTGSQKIVDYKFENSYPIEGNKAKIFLEFNQSFLFCGNRLNATHSNLICSIIELKNNNLTIGNQFDFDSTVDLDLCEVLQFDYRDDSKLLSLPKTENIRDFLMICGINKTSSVSTQMPYISHLKFNNEFHRIEEIKKLAIDLTISPIVDYKFYQTDLIYVYESEEKQSTGKSVATYNYVNIVKTEQNDTNIVTKLGRYCTNDTNFNSYSEIRISCQLNDTDEYTYARSALFFDFESKGQFELFVAFSQYDGKMNKTKGSIICAYDSGDLNQFYRNLTRECYDGDPQNSTRLMPHYRSSLEASSIDHSNRCTKAKLTNEYCTEDSVNAFIESKNDLYLKHSRIVYEFDNETISELKATKLKSNQTILWVHTTERTVFRLNYSKNNFHLADTLDLSNLVVSMKKSKSLIQANDLYFSAFHFLIKYPFDRYEKSKSTPSRLSLMILLVLTPVIIFPVLICYCSSKKSRALEEVRVASSSQLSTTFSDDYLHSIKETELILEQNNILISEAWLTVLQIDKRNGRGQLKRPETAPIDVSIKTLDKIHTDDHAKEMIIECKNLMEEALIMKEFQHKNIIPLIGVCLEMDSLPKILTPFCNNGTLLDYIGTKTNSLIIEELLNFAIQIAEGMLYLSEQGYLHGALTARHCMIDDNLNVRISEFSCLRNIRYNQLANINKLLIRWTAPEYLDRLIISIRSDVWSFGVVLWELMTRGAHPYNEIEDSQIFNSIKNGYRLFKPNQCPVQIYELMLDCWHIKRKIRPLFDKIIQRIKIIIEKNKEQIIVSSKFEFDYEYYPIHSYYATNLTSSMRNEQIVHAEIHIQANERN